MFNPFNLASDLMEPFRVLVDRKVYEMKPDKFEHKEKMKLLALFQDIVIIGGRHEYVSNAIKLYTKSIFDAISDEDISLIKFYNYEL